MSDVTDRVLFATDAAASGAEHVETAVAYDAIVLAGFGGPEGQDDVIPFLRNVTRGRGIPDERLEEVAHHYRHFGGVSPINAQNRALKAALEAELASRGIELPVLWGNRNWDPYLREALEEAAERGFTRLIGLATSAYSSYSSCRQYREDFAGALEQTGLGDRIQIDKVRQFFDHPGFVEPFVDGLRTAVADFVERGIDRGAIRILFSTHSIPTADAERSGPRDRDFGEGGAYAAQHRAVAEVVVREAGVDIPWQLVYQSRSGPPSQPWLEPDVNDRIEELARHGVGGVVVVPIGFVSDHMEVIYDLDTEAAATAEKVGVEFVRAATAGVDPRFVTMVRDLLLERATAERGSEPRRLSVGSLGPSWDVCPVGCCPNPRGDRPALCGRD